MARTHSTYTASPTRFRSPHRSPAHRASPEGSQYEMDLDALGLNSTFESTELEGAHEPPVDRVDTSEIEGPEDFTMNMTYWMTADLPLAQIKSRKEANATRQENRMAVLQQEQDQDTTEEGDRPIGTTDELAYSTPLSERSMENDEKVRSFLSALPDTNMEDALTGTPPHAPQQSFLQVPRPSPPKARSLQATVEDYDTPRKPTQETVIHHMSAADNSCETDAERDQIAELQARLEQQEFASKTRITELETILSYTRSELDASRTENYRHTEKLASLEKSMEEQKAAHEDARKSVESQLKAQEATLNSKMLDFGEEMRMQNLARLKNQREDFERQLAAQEEAKQLVDEEVAAKGQALERMKTELGKLRQSHDRDVRVPQQSDDGQREEGDLEGRAALLEQLSTFKIRAESLQAQLEKATTEARIARESEQKKNSLHNAMESKYRTQVKRISDLESHLQATRFELECAHADVAAKQQLFQTNLDLNSQLRTMRSRIEDMQSKPAADDQHTLCTAELESRIASILTQLEKARTDVAAKDEQILRHLQLQELSDQRLNTAQGRVEGLETTVTTLRQQLAEAHRESARVQANAERFERDLEDAKDQWEDDRAEAERRVTDVVKKLSKMKELKVEAETKLREMQAQREDLVEGHEALLEDVRDRAEDAVRKAGALLEQERNEKRRIVKDLKNTRNEVEKLRAEAAQRTTDDQEEEDASDDDESSSATEIDTKAKDSEIATLRDIIRKQITETKTLKSEITMLRSENKKLKSTTETFADLQATVSSLEAQVNELCTEKHELQRRLDAQEEDFEAVNAAMDEKLAAMLSKFMKERAKKVVGKRDGQWAETVEKVHMEKELLGKVLLRQWGREEIGVADEKHGERQAYGYKYVKRS